MLERTGGTLLVSVLWLVPLGGCGSAATGPDRDAAAKRPDVVASHGASEPLPLRMTGIGLLRGQDFAPGFGPPDFGKSDFGGRCSVPSDFVIRFSLDGEGAHLGSYAADLEHCTHIDWATGFSTLLDGVVTITAANGDELWGRYERSGGSGTPEHYLFNGGTGRFADASGEGMALVACDRATGTCEFQLEGWILYDASDRREQ